ncbi:hypothetical protein ACP70R_008837 [Stipagrostis hirtigluma subsp. patula]
MIWEGEGFAGVSLAARAPGGPTAERAPPCPVGGHRPASPDRCAPVLLFRGRSHGGISGFQKTRAEGLCLVFPSVAAANGRRKSEREVLYKLPLLGMAVLGRRQNYAGVGERAAAIAGVDCFKFHVQVVVTGNVLLAASLETWDCFLSSHCISSILASLKSNTKV